MAKDAKGHGSEGHGGSSAAQDTMKRLAAARKDPNHPLGALTNAVSGAVERGTATPIAGVPAHSAGVDAVGKVPLMQARHFQMIADTLKAHQSQVRTDPIAHKALVGAFADNLAKSNPKFNRGMFTKAAGG